MGGWFQNMKTSAINDDIEGTLEPGIRNFILYEVDSAEVGSGPAYCGSGDVGCNHIKTKLRDEVGLGT